MRRVAENALPSSSRRHVARMLRVGASVALAAALLAPASPALAKRYDTDCIAGTPLSACDLTRTVAPSIDAASGLLVAEDGRALWSRKVDARRAMASTTKIMTALVVLERADLDAYTTVSARAANVPYAVGLQPGERVTVRQLLELTLVASSNDAAVALAEHVSGSVGGFVEAMNARAASMDLDDTHFANPHGLDAAKHYSSSADLATLMRTAMSIPEYRRIVALRSVALPEREDRAAKKIDSTDKLLRSYSGLLGGKTGFTDDAKYSMVASAEKDGVTLTAVVLGAPSSAARFRACAKLLDWGFEHVRVTPVITATETVGTVPLGANRTRSVPVRADEATSALVFDVEGPVERRLLLDRNVRVPVFEGQRLGTIEVVQGERLLKAIDAVAVVPVASALETVGAVPVSDYLDRAVPVRAADASAAVEPYDTSLPVQRRITLESHADAPIGAGDELGTITYTQNGRVIARVPAVAADDVPEPGPLTKIGTWFLRRWRDLTGAPQMASLEVVRD